ncbi:MAG: hypothetical protein ACO1NX_08340 [Chitinophagaceae bacterium]
MKKATKIILASIIIILILAVAFEYSGINSKYRTSQPVKVNPEPLR